MAVQPDVDNPVFGYFVSTDFFEVTAYITNLLESHNCSISLILHSSGIFEKDGESRELHLPQNPPIILDPQMPEDIIYDTLQNQFYLCQEPEHYQNMEGSGWSFIPGTVRYWFKALPCQPNDGADDNNSNQNDDPEDNSTLPDVEYNYFLYNIVEYYARKQGESIPRLKILKFQYLKEYNRTANLGFTPDDFDITINLQDVAEYHADLNFLNIRIFSMRGNVLYAKKFSPDIDEWIDMYLNSYNRIALVLNLWSLFKKKYSQFFCMNCLKWKSKDGHTCEKKITTSKTDEVTIPDIPWDRHALVAYADFESYIEEGIYHHMSGWSCAIIDREHTIRSNKYMNITDLGPRDETLVKTFVQYLVKESMKFSCVQIVQTDECCICNKPFSHSDTIICGRNYINGKAGNHHEQCWLHPKNTMYVFFHNFRGYDSHFLIKELVANLNVLHLQASSMEKFNLISIMGWKQDENTREAFDVPYIRITFKDTYNFFTCSLAKCVSMIEDWRYTPEDARNSKGVFPYDWFNDPNKLWEKALPSAPWFNALTNQPVDPTPAFELWERKNFEYFSEFHDYYMNIDVLQLADAFEEFRRTCVAEFNTDPAHFQGAPGLTWYLGLCQNPKLFRIIKDKGVYMDIQNNIRGGMSQAMTRYCNVEDKPNESMFFLDVNSLYSKCMTYKMPGKYLYSKSDLPDNWRELYNENTNLTAIMVVDLVYPEHLHDRDWAYPLAPHKYNDRLCTTFKNREMYMVHAELLAFYLDRGLILEDFHYMYIFEQDYTLRDYVQSNIEKRRHTNSEVMKTLYKLLNNSLYGKTCENVNKYRHFDVIQDESLELESLEIIGRHFNADLSEATNVIPCGDQMLVELPVKEVRLNKPIQIGFTILEFAKREIYKFIAACQDYFGDKVVPLYTDTDSLLMWCDFNKPWLKFFAGPLKEFLDFEKAPDHWNVRTIDTDKQSGLWSPEAGGKEIVEYCGLRAKSYAYRFRDNTVVIKNKGIPKAAMIDKQDETPREKITIEHYKQALFNGAIFHVSQFNIRSLKHEVISKEEFKLGISANDLKRAVTKNRAISLPFGYKGEIWRHLVTDFDDDSLLDP
uniref:DNA-directed DNA polymerase n=1 Tax=Phylloscopus fuscatus densovirus TaxID=2794500 RepID=A0A8A4XDJ9_9VIRU|nr:MAG: PolB [Phylloscopus fuscatus densovirus]